MTSQTQTPRQELADMKLGGSLEEFVRSRRDKGRAWRLVERDLYEATDGAVDITFETLRTWFPDKPTPPPDLADTG